MKRLAYLTMICTFMLLWFAAPVAAQKIKIEKLDDLPRYTYKLEIKVEELFKNDEALLNLAHQVKADLEGDLDKYEISDKTTLKGYYGILGMIAMLDKEYDVYLKYFHMANDLEDKEASRLTAGMFSRSYITAMEQGGDDIEDIIKSEYSRRVNELPYEIVEADLKAAKGRAEILSENLLLGVIQSQVQPILDETGGEMSKEIAQQILGMNYTTRYYLPYKHIIIEVLDAYLTAHKTEKLDIWAERDVVLKEGEGKGPVIICIWDSGTDIPVFEGKLWTNEDEIADNDVDDDNNGFIDDVHGIAYTLHSDKTTELLYPVDNVKEDAPRLQRLMKGLTDLQANIDSEESAELKKAMSEMTPEQVKPFLEGISKYANYAHGTHVAGIALRGNPYARLLTSRLTFDYRMLPEEPTIEQAKKDAAAVTEMIKYFQDNGARVVNMSWGGSLAGIERALEANNAGGTPEERKALAREIFEIDKNALFEGMKNASEILFVTSAGNSDNDVSFEEFLPSGFDLPNILSVGAVDQAGDETGFTSFGKVDVYANGFEVLSFIPGGDEMKVSGSWRQAVD